MKSAMRVGRVTGVLVFAHLALGLITPFVLLDRVRTPAGFLAGAANHAMQMRAAVFLLFVGSAVAIGIAITAWPVVCRYSSAAALWLLALAVAGFSLQAVDNGALMSMLSLSQEYAKESAAKPEFLQVMAVVTGAARKWAHYTALLVAVSWIFLLGTVLYRFRLVPRVLAAFVVAGSLLQIAGVTLPGFLGIPPEMRLAMPLAPAYLALAVWLMVNGFDLHLGSRAERPPVAEAAGVGIGTTPA